MKTVHYFLFAYVAIRFILSLIREAKMKQDKSAELSGYAAVLISNILLAYAIYLTI